MNDQLGACGHRLDRFCDDAAVAAGIAQRTGDPETAKVLADPEKRGRVLRTLERAMGREAVSAFAGGNQPDKEAL